VPVSSGVRTVIRAEGAEGKMSRRGTRTVSSAGTASARRAWSIAPLRRSRPLPKSRLVKRGRA
jgi:hypothetical protein